MAEADVRSIRKSFRVPMLTPEFLGLGRLDAEVSVGEQMPRPTPQRKQLNDIGQPALALQDPRRGRGPLGMKSFSERFKPKKFCVKKTWRHADEAFEECNATTLERITPPPTTLPWPKVSEQTSWPQSHRFFSRAFALDQTATALEGREACYRILSVGGRSRRTKIIERWKN